MTMFRPIQLNLEDVVKLVGSAKSEEFFYEENSEMAIKRELLMECKLTRADREVVEDIPPNTVLRMSNIDMGTFAIQLF